MPLTFCVSIIGAVQIICNHFRRGGVKPKVLQLITKAESLEEYKEKIRQDLKENAIQLDGFKLQTKCLDKYLGQVIKSDLASSALATVQDREGKIKGAAIEIKSIIEDYQMQAMGGLEPGWEK